MIAAYNHNPLSYLVALVIAGAYAIAQMASRRKQQDAAMKRSNALQALAPQLGFDAFFPQRDKSFAEGWSILSHLSQGNDRYAFNIFQGTWQDHKLFVFDYHYNMGDQKYPGERYCTMLMLIVKQYFPKITIRTERPGDNIILRLTADIENVKFESAEFSSVFRVHSLDKKFAYDVCNPQMMEYLLANRDLDIEIQGPVILLAFTPQLAAGQIESSLQRLAQIRALLPQYLFEKTGQ